MDTDRIRKAARAAIADGSYLRALGQILGFEIVLGGRPEVLQTFGDTIEAPVEGCDGFALGYRASLVDVVNSILLRQREVAQHERRSRRAEFPEWREVLRRLMRGPRAQYELGDDASKVSRLLAAMRNEGLVERWPYGDSSEAADVRHDRRERLHQLTAEGRRIVVELQLGEESLTEDLESVAGGSETDAMELGRPRQAEHWHYSTSDDAAEYMKSDLNPIAA